MTKTPMARNGLLVLVIEILSLFVIWILDLGISQAADSPCNRFHPADRDIRYDRFASGGPWCFRIAPQSNGLLTAR